jgi:hypothetical protein
MVTYFPSGITTGRPVISSCSLRKVMIEPLKDTEPMTTVKTVAASASFVTWPALALLSTNSATATSAAAPPPTPL